MTPQSSRNPIYWSFSGPDSWRLSVPQVSSAFVAPAELLEELEKRANPVALGPMRVLFRQGDLPLGVYILREGKALLTSQSDGNAIQTVEAGPGSLFGLSAAVGAKPYSLTAEALEGAELSLLTCEEFIQLMQTEPSLSFRVLQVLAEELRFARETIEFGNLAWPTSAVCFGPPSGTLMLRELGSAGA